MHIDIHRIYTRKYTQTLMNLQKHTCYIHIHNITINTGTRLCGSFDCLILRTYTVCAWDLWTAEWPNSAHSCIWHLIWETLEVTDVFQFARKSRTSSCLYGNVILHHGKRSKRAYCAACSCLTDKIQLNENKEGWVKKKKNRERQRQDSVLVRTFPPLTSHNNETHRKAFGSLDHNATDPFPL